MTEASNLIEATLAESLLVFEMIDECPRSIDVLFKIADRRPFLQQGRVLLDSHGLCLAGSAETTVLGFRCIECELPLGAPAFEGRKGKAFMMLCQKWTDSVKTMPNRRDATIVAAPFGDYQGLRGRIEQLETLSDSESNFDAIFAEMVGVTQALQGRRIYQSVSVLSFAGSDTRRAQVNKAQSFLSCLSNPARKCLFVQDIETCGSIHYVKTVLPCKR